MKIVVKTLNGKQLGLEVEDSFTVRQIKEKIETEHSIGSADSLKLIRQGKVLDDDSKSATEVGLAEGDFIVAMVQKAKPAAKPKPDPVPEPKEAAEPKADPVEDKPKPESQP